MTRLGAQKKKKDHDDDEEKEDILLWCITKVLNVWMLFEIFTEQNSNFQGGKLSKKCNFEPKLPVSPQA